MRTAGILAAAAALLAGPAAANSGCESAALKDDLHDQIRLYTICLGEGEPATSVIGRLQTSNRGAAYLQTGQAAEALGDFTDAVDTSRTRSGSYVLNTDLEYGVAYLNRARIYWERGDHDLALADIDSALDLKLPSKGVAHFHRGRALAALGDERGARAALEEAVDRERRLSAAKFALALVLSTGAAPELRDGERAVELALDGLEDDDTVLGRVALSAAYAETGMFEDALGQLGYAAQRQRDGGAEPSPLLSEYAQQIRAEEPIRRALSDPRSAELFALVCETERVPFQDISIANSPFQVPYGPYRWPTAVCY